MILIDSSVWIEYFKGNKNSLPLNKLIDLNNVCTNDLILSELIPAINQKKESDIKNLLLEITKIPLRINWNDIIQMQTLNLKNGINKIGIPDLIIAQNAVNNNLEIFSMDNHFFLMAKYHKLKIYKA
jgi:predicted nucleic acid-binding protein